MPQEARGFSQKIRFSEVAQTKIASLICERINGHRPTQISYLGTASRNKDSE
jgi:hypothetical protein